MSPAQPTPPAPPRPSAAALRRARRQLEAWFAQRGWTPLRFQRGVWRRALAGGSGPLHTPTGSGKTLAVAGVSLLEALARAESAPATKRRMRAAEAHPLRLLWITPLRALAADTTRALREPAAALGLD